MNNTIQEEINNNNLRQVMSRYNLQVVHEDNDTYVLEDMSQKRTMVRGAVVKIFQTDIELLNYLKHLECC